jgi:hypothetical protein
MLHALRCVLLGSLFLLAFSGRTATADQSRSIAGQWRVELDPKNVGVQQRWFDRDLPRTIQLPGSTDEAKLGPGNPAPPTLDGLYRVYPYQGPAWYQYQLLIPGSWAGKRVALYLERVHGTSRIWIDGQEVPGAEDSLIAPHVHELGALGTPGTRRLTVRVDNTPTIDLGPFVSIRYEGTQTNWNGLVGALELRARDPVAIADVRVDPDAEHRVARIRVRIENSTGKAVEGTLRLSVRPREGGADLVADEVAFSAQGPATELVRELALGPNAALWDEFSPALHVVHASVEARAGQSTARDEQSVRFGLRSFAPRGTQFTINGRPIYLRGTLECGIFPLTGYPPTDVAAWRKIDKIIKSYGLNSMRFHSWCPPEAAFTAADLEGVYLQVEGPQANIDAGSDPLRDAFVEAELLRIIRTYGNHPSFCLMTLGNEYGGSSEVLARWIDMLRAEDARHLYASPSAGQTTANRQFTEGGPRGVSGPGTARDFRADLAREDRPLVGHEIGQWTFYPNFAEIPKYSGVLKAANFELVRADVEAKHLSDLAPSFVQATGRHAALLYKEEIEVLLRTPGYAGFSLLDLHDYPGQGTALIGILDPFWASKGFVTPEAHARYCGPTVPLVRMPKRSYTTDEAFVAEAELAHYGPSDLADARPTWSIDDDQGIEIASSRLNMKSIPTGQLTHLGSIRAEFSSAPAPCALTVTLALEGTPFSNSWRIWVYPPSAPVQAPADLIVSRQWDEATRSALAQGKSVVLLPRAIARKHTLPGRFLPVFWSPIWFPDQKPNTMGILCDPHHPLFARFPTDFHSDWQWYELIDHSRSLILDDTAPEFRPIVAVIDNFQRNHRLGTVLEARVGRGRLLICTIDLPALAATQPAARQFLTSLYNYAASDAFRPTHPLETEWLEARFATAQFEIMERLGARILSTDSQHESHPAAHLLDGDPNTFWHTPWGEQAPPFPHSVVIDFPALRNLAGLQILPRQDLANGRIRQYRVECSPDGETWNTVAEGALNRSADETTIAFQAPEPTRQLRFTALSGFDNQPFASLAELAVIEAKP